MLFVVMLALTACESKSGKLSHKDKYLNSETETPDKPKRIHTIESNFSTSTYIVEVDGHEYLVNYHGGIVHLETCPCKTKQ